MTNRYVIKRITRKELNFYFWRHIKNMLNTYSNRIYSNYFACTFFRQDKSVIRYAQNYFEQDSRGRPRRPAGGGRRGGSGSARQAPAHESSSEDDARESIHSSLDPGLTKEVIAKYY